MIITQAQYLRVIFTLPSIKNDNDVYSTIVDGIPLFFSVLVEEDGNKGWVLDNATILNPPRDRKMQLFCVTCQDKTEHMINKESNRVRCETCKKITDIKLDI